MELPLPTAKRGDHITTSSVEDHSLVDTSRFLEEEGYRLTYLPVDKYRMVNPNDLKLIITDKTILISIMHANNEVGIIEPIAEMGHIANVKRVPFHADAI